MKKLIPALALLVVSAILMGTSTFAWFSLNNKVNVTGMTVKTKIGDSIQIAESTLSKTTKEDTANFNNGLHKVVKGVLEPVSTVDGKNFWYNSTSNVDAAGNALADTYLDYDAVGKTVAGAAGYTDKFSLNYQITDAYVESKTGESGPALGYVDYVFQLKATNTGDSDKILKLTRVNLLYNYVTATTNIKAFRVAVFAEKWSSSFAADAGTLKTILRPASSAYFDESTVSFTVNTDTTGTSSGSDGLFEYIDSELYGDNATPESVTKWYNGDTLASATEISSTYVTVAGTGGNATKVAAAPLAVNGDNTLSKVQQLSQAANIDTITAGQTEYYKVVVRMWLEGEDDTCNNDTYATLNGEWALDLSVELSAGDGVTAIGSSEIDVNTVTDDTATITLTTDKLSNGEEPKAYTWYNEDGSAASGGTADNNVFKRTTSGTAKYYCIIETTKGNFYRTKLVELSGS